MGSYTLFIEAVREKGTHQLIRTGIEIGDQPFEKDSKGNIEISSVHLSYGMRKQ